MHEIELRIAQLEKELSESNATVGRLEGELDKAEYNLSTEYKLNESLLARLVSMLCTISAHCHMDGKPLLDRGRLNERDIRIAVTIALSAQLQAPLVMLDTEVV